MPRDVQIKIGAVDNASRVLGKVRGNVGSLESVTKKVAGSAMKMGTAIAASAVAAGVAIKKLMDDFAEAGDLIHKTALRTKLSAEFLSELGFAAEQSGTSLDQMSQAIFRAFRRLGNAETGTGPAARAMKELGVNVKALAAQKPETIFFTLVDALNSLEDPLRRSQMGFEIFGDNWRQIAPLLETGSVEIRKLMKEGQALGVSLSGEQAEAAAAYTDEMNRLSSVLIGIRNEIAMGLAPAFTGLAEVIRFSLQNASTIITAFQVKVLDLNITIMETLDAITDLDPFASRDASGRTAAGVAVDVLKQKRSAAIADAMSSMLGGAISGAITGATKPPATSGFFTPGGGSDGGGMDGAGGGLWDLLGNMGDMIKDLMGQFFMLIPDQEAAERELEKSRGVQATQSRLLTRGIARDPQKEMLKVNQKQAKAAEDAVVALNRIITAVEGTPDGTVIEVIA